MRILITAGPTREYVDTVRFISNASSGRLGVALAAAAAARGHRVTLVHGPIEVPQPVGVRCVCVVSAAEMLAACEKTWPRHDVLIMTAAVADYTPAELLRHKLKKKRSMLTLKLRPTADILAKLSGGRRRRQIVIGFALEDRAARANAAEKLARKNLDAIVLNHPCNIAARDAAISVLVRGGRWENWGRVDKSVLAERLLTLAERLWTPGGRLAGLQEA